MKRLTKIAVITVLVTACAACTTQPGTTGDRTKKVAEQRLAAYTPIRRLAYRDACGSDGPLTVCVDRISISDSAVLVEARIRNASPQPYLQGNRSGASVLLADETGMTLVGYNGEAMEFQGVKEKGVHFRMEGHFAGEPAIFMVNDIRKKGAAQADQAMSIMARLGD